MGFPGGSDGKNPPVMQEAWVRSLGWEDLLEKGKAVHPSILAWRIPWMEDPGAVQSMWWQRVQYIRVTNISTFIDSLSPKSLLYKKREGKEIMIVLLIP